MLINNSIINFVIPELTEPEKVFSSRHFWTIVVSDSKVVIYRADSGKEVLLLSFGIFISHFIRKFKVTRLLGTDIERVLETKKKKYVFNRQSEFKIKLSVTERGDFGNGMFLLLGDSTKIVLTLANLEKLKQAINELEFDYKLIKINPEIPI